VIYIDTSCLVKLFRLEALSGAVRAAIKDEPIVVVSVLVELEALVQLKAAWKAGEFSRAQWRRLETELGLLRNQPPFDFQTLPAALFRTALRQHRNSGQAHCRSLDRLHLAAMEELEFTRLMTHDRAQAAAALDAGFQVIQPGRS
jgi:uncharacterized protein with PIN domain